METGHFRLFHKRHLEILLWRITKTIWCVWFLF